MPHDWSSGFLRQALSDYRMFKRIECDAEAEDSHRLYFLLKMGEKAGQSYLTDGTSPPPKDSNHKALLRFFKAVKSDPLVRARVGVRFKLQKFVDTVEKIEKFTKELHKFVATNERSANCEYPWEDGAGRILVPAEERFSVIGPGNASLLQKYVRLFERWFAASGLSVIPEQKPY